MMPTLARLPIARLLAAGLLLAAAAFPGAQRVQAQQLQPLDHIVAVADEDVVLQSELDRAVRNVLSQYAGREDQLPPRDVLERQVLERIILTKLQVARAESSGLKVSDAEVDEAIGNIAKQNNLDMDQLRAQLAHDGMALSDLRSSIRDELTIQRLKQSFARSRISVSEGEVDAALANQAGSRQYHLAHLLVSVPEGATAGQIDAAQKKIEDIKAQIDQGSLDFAAAAVRYSDSPNALEGGDLGWRDADQIPPSFAQAISSMQPGQTIGPVRGPSGFQLIELIESRDAADSAATVTQYKARHLLVKAGDGDDAAAKARIDTLRARIAGGADFAEVAKQATDDDATTVEAGDLGWFVADAHGAEFSNQLGALADGEVSPPFRTEAGWEIVQREGSRQVPAADDNRRQQVRESIGNRKLEEQWNSFLREMRGEAYVDIRLPAAQSTSASGG